ncbi:MAG TPA: hypothetical protein VKU01_37175 [Bryobacteraceae bacterium]|nr:hypothetical protein [Bryobacteraceae bacterium]
MILALFLELPGTVLSMSVAGLALLAIGLWAAKNDIVQARGIDKIVALTYLCFGTPLAVFGSEHLSREKFLLNMVPSYMPLRSFWLYFVGIALIAAGLSIVTKIKVQWSGLLVGIMMFLFVAMLYLPGAIRIGGRMAWTIVFRETSFGSAGWVLAGFAMGGNSRPGKILINVGRVLIGLTAIFFGIQHFLHPLVLPVVPLQRQMPTWVPSRPVTDYMTGAFLVVAGGCFLLSRKTRMAAAYLGAWILLLLEVIYAPVLIASLADPGTQAKVEGISYFADTLLFCGVILSVARATARQR